MKRKIFTLQDEKRNALKPLRDEKKSLTFFLFMFHVCLDRSLNYSSSVFVAPDQTFLVLQNCFLVGVKVKELQNSKK